MMQLPIDRKEFDAIIEILRVSGNQKLYNKLWSYKINYLIKGGKSNGFFE